jgi:predicted transcriptional regulator
LRYPGKIENSHLPIKVDNKKLYEWFGVNPSKKWEALNKLENKKIIELKRGGRGRLPTVRIIAPKKKLN